MSDGLVIAVYDYPRGDMADLEVRLALRRHVPGWSIETASINSFKTLSTGMVLAQAACSEIAESLAPGNVVVYGNCAPRKDIDSERDDNEGEGLVYVELDNGVRMLVVNSGYSLSFLKDRIVALYEANVSDKGSQFRSRDNFPEMVGAIAAGKLSSVKGAALDPESVIPDLPERRIAYIDSFGNLKLTMRSDDPFFASLTEGQKVRIKIGRTPGVATMCNGSFSVCEGELAFAPGSSGYDRRFLELFLRGGSAADLFHAEEEESVEIRLLP